MNNLTINNLRRAGNKVDCKFGFCALSKLAIKIEIRSDPISTFGCEFGCQVNSGGVTLKRMESAKAITASGIRKNSLRINKKILIKIS